MTRQRFQQIAFALASLLLVMLPLALQPAAAQPPTRSLEQQLVDLYAPIVMIKSQTVACSDTGEQFRPVAVDILFGTDDVRLMQRGAGGKSADVEVKRNLSAADLAGLDSSFYLDLPGNPRDPECIYEKWGQERMAELGLSPTLYGRVTTEPGQDGIVVQYWYYWVFNYFNNTHESDWEGIQLVFDADRIEEILDHQPLPSAIAFAQHDGGEQADADDDKVAWQGTHIVSHPSSGSHADYYASSVWLGWGENGSGFGCDFSDEPSEELPVDVILIPGDIDPAGPFAWLTYQGLWGDRQEPSMFAGPTGPNMKPRWDAPISWGRAIRGSSLPVPIKSTIGPGISEVFCGAVQMGSTLVRVFPISPNVVMGVIVAVFGAFLVLAAMAWRWFARAVRIYGTHGYFFITTGVLAFPLAVAGQRFEDFLQGSVFDWIDTRLPDELDVGGVIQYLLHAGLGGTQEILLACIVGPAVIVATRHVLANEATPLPDAWKQGAQFLPRVFGASFLIALMLLAMMLTFVLIPFAFYRSVQWNFAAQSVVVDGAAWRNARHVSSARMNGHWIRALAIGAAIAAVTSLPGVLLGTFLLIFHVVGLELAQWISAAVYCVLYPIAFIMATLFYLHCSVAPGLAEPYAPLRDHAETAADLAPGVLPA